MQADLIVAGAGPAGMAAALVASLEGLEVLLCEKSEQVGGTGATSAGTLWIPGNRESRAAGHEDRPQDAARYLDALITGPSDRALREAFLATGPDALDYFSSRTDVQFVPCGTHPDYRSLPGAALAGRAVIPKPFDGRLLGADFARLRPPMPEFMLLGGMMVGKADIAPLVGRYRSVANFRHAAGLVLRYFADRLRYARGTRIMMGNALVGRLYLSLLKRKVPILFGTAIVDVLRGDGGRVAGARLSRGGKEIVVSARNGVVLATGGFARNAKFRAAFMPQAMPGYSLSCEANAGDGIAIGERFGARIAPEEHAQGGLWAPVSITTRRDGSKGLFPHLVLDRAKPGLLAVNSAGRRFVNEAASYHDFVEAMLASHRRVPSIPAWLVCDASFIPKYGLGHIHPGTRELRRFQRNGELVSGRTLEELAGKIGVPADALAETVARHNEYARSGTDPDFGKGAAALDRFNGDPGHEPNPCIGALGTPPFYALAVWPADLAVSTGLATDADARVLDAQRRPIEGLYACGNDMASVMAGTYPGPGTTLGPALVFAYRAAIHAAKAQSLSI